MGIDMLTQQAVHTSVLIVLEDAQDQKQQHMAWVLTRQIESRFKRYTRCIPLGRIFHWHHGRWRNVPGFRIQPAWHSLFGILGIKREASIAMIAAMHMVVVVCVKKCAPLNI